jgi:hypothetical protein
MIGRSLAGRSAPGSAAGTCPEASTSMPSHLLRFRPRMPQSHVCRACGHSHRTAGARNLRFRSSPSPLVARLLRWPESAGVRA